VLDLCVLLKLNDPNNAPQLFINPFPANVANKRHLGSAPNSHFCDLTGKTEVIGLSDIMTLFLLTWGVYIANSIQCFQNKLN
jgi:hypothetical protein